MKNSTSFCTIGLVAIAFSLGACSHVRHHTDQPPPAKAAPAKVVMKKQTPPAPKPQLPPPPPPDEWSYSGNNGPSNWGSLKPLYFLCNTGKAQSPINLVWKHPKKNGGHIEFHYQPSELRIVDTGHGIQLNFDHGSYILLNGKRYDLVRADLHSPSEHTIAGNQLSMEVELVHENQDGRTAILSSVMISGAADPNLAHVLKEIPVVKNFEMKANDQINPLDLVPKIHTHYEYMGSLTMPPCTEGVSWVVFNTPLTVSDDQILAFRQHDENNARPVQPLNKRKVVNY